MHIVFQFPIIDFRPLISANAGKLNRPNWLKPDMSSKPFIRGFGSVKKRNAGGNPDFSGENFFCDAHSSLKYTDLHKQGFKVAENVKTTIHNSYRRFFSDGYFVNKVETGFVDNTEFKSSGPDLKTEGISIEAILHHYANLQVSIDGESRKLYKIGPQLAEQYYLKSTAHHHDPVENGKYVSAGEISIIVVFSPSQGIRLPDHAFALEKLALPENYGELKVFGYRLKHEGYALKVWLIEKPGSLTRWPKHVSSILRGLRLNLMRIHLEKETLRTLLNGIKTGIVSLKENSEEAKLVDAYIKKSTEKLLKKTRFGLDQKNILEFALHSEEVVAPGSFSNLEEGIYYFTNQYIRNNIEKILTGMAKKMVLFICASPRNKNPLDFGDEFMKIKNSLRLSSDQHNFDLDIEASVKKKDFLEILKTYKPDYLHISMHAELTNGLCFEDENDESLPMSVDEFAENVKTLCDTHKPFVVVLSACNSKKHAEAIKGYCDFSIGTQATFPADAGVLYAAKFYSTLFQTKEKNIPDCHQEGQKAIQSWKPPFDAINNIEVHEIPVLIH